MDTITINEKDLNTAAAAVASAFAVAHNSRAILAHSIAMFCSLFPNNKVPFGKDVRTCPYKQAVKKALADIGLTGKTLSNNLSALVALIKAGPEDIEQLDVRPATAAGKKAKKAGGRKHTAGADAVKIIVSGKPDSETLMEAIQRVLTGDKADRFRPAANALLPVIAAFMGEEVETTA